MRIAWLVGKNKKSCRICLEHKYDAGAVEKKTITGLCYNFKIFS